MSPSHCSVSDMLIGLEDILTDLNVAEVDGYFEPEQVIAAAMLLGTLQKNPTWFYTEEEVEYLRDVSAYLKDYSARMNQK